MAVRLRAHDERAQGIALITCFLWLWAPPLPAQDRSPERQEDESTQEDEGKSQQEILAERRREKAENLSPYRVFGAEDRLIRLEAVKFPLNVFERGLHGIRPLIYLRSNGRSYEIVGIERDSPQEFVPMQ